MAQQHDQGHERACFALALNAGSSSLKFELFSIADERRSCLRGAVRDIGGAASSLELDGAEIRVPGPITSHEEAVGRVLDLLLDQERGFEVSSRTVAVTAHRIVHGGARYWRPTLITSDVSGYLRSITDLAPLHIPAALAVMQAVGQRLDEVPAVAVFDTGLFHALPDVARTYAVPRRWRDEYGIRRYGFHGIAHGYMRDRVTASARDRIHDGTRAERLVTLQLGHGCSATAFRGGVPVDTSMGFTPLEGLIMSTRPGDIDGGAILHALRQGSSVETLDQELNNESGLRGLSGDSGDVRELLERESAGDADARLALDAFCYRILKYLGAYAAALGGIEALAFGGGIGENSVVLRQRICQGLGWLGLELDAEANDACIGEERRISTDSSSIDVHVIRVHEEVSMARAAIGCLEQPHCSSAGHGEVTHDEPQEV